MGPKLRFSLDWLLWLGAGDCKLSGRTGAVNIAVSPHRKTGRRPKNKGRAKLRGRTGASGPGRKQGAIGRARGSQSAGEWFEKLVALQTQLRAPGGCPWDREQTHESLRKYLVEETYEVLDAMGAGDAREFASELGDLLLQVVFHSVMAEEAGRFTIADVIESIHSKMLRRHPHVFGNVKAATSAEVLKNWEQLKAEERAAEGKSARREGADGSILAGVSRSLPAALEAYELTRRAAKIGFDWDDIEGIFEKIDEEKREILSAVGGKKNDMHGRIEEEAGDLIFAAVNVARFLDVEPEIALKKANRKFKERIARMESAARREGKRLAELPRARMEELWDESKSKKTPHA
jgi:MazG family protein